MSVIENVLAVGLQAGLSLTATSLTYTSIADSENPIDLMGTQGKKLFKIQEPGNPIIVVESVDFLIFVSDLVLDGILIKPQRNDEIARIRGTKKLIYKVLPMGREIPFFEYSDTGQTVFRIHTKAFREEDVV
tara:strand:- start:932 stop:1327 length:396 start_codon:yes stop_codon:yes gene_type:complete